MIKNLSINQFLPSLSPHDAIGNETLEIQCILQDMGFRSDIYCEHVHKDLAGKAIVSNLDYFKASPNEIMFYHYAVYSKAILNLASASASVWLRYHNVTPERFFDPVTEPHSFQACEIGRKQLPLATLTSEFIFAASEFNKSEIDAIGHSNSTVVPLLRNYEALFSKNSDHDIVAKLDLHKERNICLFVGRLVPNKRQQDLIQMIRLYKQFVSDKIRLILVGSSYSKSYEFKLKEYAQDLGLKVCESKAQAGEDFDVLFTGSVRDEELLALYKSAKVFVSASEHEGFCIPLVEAMGMGLPIVAHSSSAIPETIGKAGLLVNKFNPQEFLSAVKSVLTNEQVQSQLSRLGKVRHQELSFPATKKLFVDTIEKLVSQR